MALIKLSGIGKIYVSDSNVSVGIRGVDLSFDKGEFVAVTGKSGSGKSTLLNVISGMDSYEEGEMYVDGEATSHYIQQDWEEYRKKYISFIFQDYNIIESFTVLQNVELALMHIESSRERKKRAVELLRRVGMESHLRSRGSHLSGGQKQRTVIARALAKDSPIILADEPTGNLDSVSSAEIISLLREVSKDKLVIVVTHNFEQVREYATRHIRIFDGAVEFDQPLEPPAKQEIEAEVTEESAAGAVTESAPPRKGGRVAAFAARQKNTLKNGLTLGCVRFRATPKLSVFMCLLITLCALFLFVITSSTGVFGRLFQKNYVFTPVDGRVIVVRSDGGVMTDTEIAELSEKAGAKSYLHYDYLLDQNVSVNITSKQGYKLTLDCICTYEKNYAADVGRMPYSDGEVLLSLPLYYQDIIASFSPYAANLFGTEYTVTGLDFYADNTLSPKLVFTESGFATATALCLLNGYSSNSLLASSVITDNQPDGQSRTSTYAGTDIILSFDLGEKSYYDVNKTAGSNDYRYFNDIRESGVIPGYDFTVETTLTGTVMRAQVGGVLTGYTSVSSPPPAQRPYKLAVSPDIVRKMVTTQYLETSYTQASLFFSGDLSAGWSAEKLRELGYNSVLSTITKELNSTEAIMNVLITVGTLVGWLLASLFISLFLVLCSARAMKATRGDVGIMRSMGIPKAVIKLSVYVQTMIALIPAFIMIAVAGILVACVPVINGIFTFLHAGEYVLILLMMILINVLVSRRHVKKLFAESVKKTLKGGQE